METKFSWIWKFSRIFHQFFVDFLEISPNFSKFFLIFSKMCPVCIRVSIFRRFPGLRKFSSRWIPEFLKFYNPLYLTINSLFSFISVSPIFMKFPRFSKKPTMCIRPCQWIWGVDPEIRVSGIPKTRFSGGRISRRGVPPPENPPLIYGVHIQLPPGPEICPPGQISGGRRTTPENLPDPRIPWKSAWILARNSCFCENQVFVILTAIYLENMRRLAYIRAKMAKKRPQNPKKPDFQVFKDLDINL